MCQKECKLVIANCIVCLQKYLIELENVEEEGGEKVQVEEFPASAQGSLQKKVITILG